MPFDETDDLHDDEPSDGFSIRDDEETKEDDEDPEKHGFHVEGEEDSGTDSL